jgi:branched-chain amino acid transport system substrate-binding protein
MGMVRLPKRLSGRRVLVAIAALTLSSCGAAQTGGASDPSPFALDATGRFEQDAVAELPLRPTYRIGINTEVTGTGAQIGDLSIRAARLAVEEINAAGGIDGVPLELVVRDCRSDPGVALEQYRLAMADDHLTALIGPFKSAYAVHIVPEHRLAMIPMLIGATNATLTELGDPNLFRMRPSDRLTAAAMTAIAVDQLNKHRIAIIHDSDTFGTGGAQNITTYLASRGLAPILQEAYRTGSRDFDLLVRAVAQAQPDAVLIYATNTTDLGFLLRAIRYWNLDASIITSPSGATAVTHDIALDAQDQIYVAMDAYLPATPAGLRFAHRFVERFGIPADTYIAWYYDAIYLLADILRVHGDDPQMISRALRTAAFEGIQGRYHFDERGEGLHEVTLVRMQDGKARRIGVYGDQGYVAVADEQP